MRCYDNEKAFNLDDSILISMKSIKEKKGLYSKKKCCLNDEELVHMNFIYLFIYHMQHFFICFNFLLIKKSAINMSSHAGNSTRKVNSMLFRSYHAWFPRNMLRKFSFMKVV